MPLDNADLSSGTARCEVSATFLELRAGRGLSLGPARGLIAAVAGDLAHRPFQTEAELTAYADGVAGTVGLMMCDVLAARRSAARERARRLGRAMRLTNIARDVIEDARVGQRYLPANWGALKVEALADPDAAGLDGLRAREPRARLAVAGF